MQGQTITQLVVQHISHLIDDQILAIGVRQGIELDLCLVQRHEKAAAAHVA